MTPVTWKKIGTLERDGKGLRVTVTAFGKTTIGTISQTGVRLLLSPGGPAADIMRTQRGIDGAEVTEKIGYIRRSRSGRGVIVNLTTAPECSGSWATLEDLIYGVKEKVNLSTMEEALPFQTEPAPVKAAANNDIRAGLSSRF